jgi:hypothetical protein
VHISFEGIFLRSMLGSRRFQPFGSVHQR